MASAACNAEVAGGGGGGRFGGGGQWLKGLVDKLVEVGSKAKKLSEEDPRRVVHSFKVGFAITLVSLFYYFEPLYDGFGVSAMWAVLTVVVVLEFTVGATLGKGVNRGIATLVAGSLGVGAHRLANFSGKTCEPLLLGIFVFTLAAVVTFIRFFPRMKARYDYGLIIFILTFCLISVSGYRDDEVVDMAERRLSTIVIGGTVAVIICLVIRPVWAGDDLHNLVAANMEKLGTFLEGFGNEHFKRPSTTEESKAFMQGYKSVLNSKGSEESLANFAKWEPPHGKFRYPHPWEQYLKIGTLTRQCSYRIEALNGYLNSELKPSREIQKMMEESCTKMSRECSCCLKDLALAVKKMTKPSSANSHIAKSKTAAKSLKSVLKSGSWLDADLLEIVPAATVASLLIDVVTCTEKIAESVNELASLAKFKSMDDADAVLTISEQQPKVKTSFSVKGPDQDHHVVTIYASNRKASE